MHQDFRQLLTDAEGDSQRLVAMNVDIRGFSEFSEEVESVLAALYIKKVYEHMIDDYFSDADWFKPTGDGLLVVYSFNDETLRPTAVGCIRKALKLVRAFPRLTAKDPAINFEVPTNVGIGLARSAGSRLKSGDKILDYSGRTLNLASRLMDFARPQGVVLDSDYGVELLPPSIRNQFRRTEVAIKGISEKELVPIYYTSAMTSIPEWARRPIKEPEWATVERPPITLRQLSDYGESYRIALPAKPLAPSQIQMTVTFPKVTVSGQRHKTIRTNAIYQSGDPGHGLYYHEDAGKPYLRFRPPQIVDYLRDKGVKDGWPVSIRVVYAKA